MTDANNGVVVSDDNGVYFIPADQLAQFKLSAEAAEGVNDALDGEVAGFGHTPSLRQARFAFVGDFKPMRLDMQYSDNPVAKFK